MKHAAVISNIEHIDCVTLRILFWRCPALTLVERTFILLGVVQLNLIVSHLPTFSHSL